jgi:hypothetical protein
MYEATFVNFIAFGKRTSIDLRVVISNAGHVGIPAQIHVGLEDENPGDYSGFMKSFVKLANAAYTDLVGKLNELGHASLVEMLESQLEEVQMEAAEEEGVMLTECYFSSWVSFFYILNNTSLVYGNPSELKGF